jgi:3-methyl-2-oxobutanoate hydroxymethyltransferase
MAKKNVSLFQKLKGNNEKIAMLTAYDYSTAKILDEAGIDSILVGDSLAMVALGYENTYSITIDEMLIFVKAVAKGAGFNS